MKKKRKFKEYVGDPTLKRIVESEVTPPSKRVRESKENTGDPTLELIIESEVIRETPPSKRVGKFKEYIGDPTLKRIVESEVIRETPRSKRVREGFVRRTRPKYTKSDGSLNYLKIAKRLDPQNPDADLMWKSIALNLSDDDVRSVIETLFKTIYKKQNVIKTLDEAMKYYKDACAQFDVKYRSQFFGVLKKMYDNKS